MSVLVFRRQYATPQLKERWNHVPDWVAAEVISVSERAQRDLERLFQQHDLDTYDRVVVDLKWAFVRHQLRALRAIPRLVVHEFDAFWNFMPDARFYLDFERFYHRLPAFRLICCGATVRNRFVAQGLDAHAVPKAYDHNVIRNLHVERDILVGFIGSVDAPVYRRRRRTLQRIANVLPLQLLRTRSPDEYVRTLNRIRFFVSADVGMSEYTAKNFEAMAAGCTLVARRQGNGEEEYLGFRNMHNVVLYSDAAEAVEKIRLLTAHPEVADEIASRGRELVRGRFTVAERDSKLFSAILPDIAHSKRDLRPIWRRCLAETLPRLRGHGR